MEVYGYDPYISVNAAWRLSRDVKHTTSLDTICQECDYITCRCSGCRFHKGMINKAAIEQMKDGVVILNLPVTFWSMRRFDLAEALKSGKVKKYVTDFANPKSVNMENHCDPASGRFHRSLRTTAQKMAVQEIMDYLENGNIRNSVNYPACDMGVKKTACRVAVYI